LSELDGIACHIFRLGRSENKIRQMLAVFIKDNIQKDICHITPHSLHCSTAFREINSLQVRQPDGGHIPTVQTPWFEEDILDRTVE
jgi:hypothetical protein